MTYDLQNNSNDNLFKNNIDSIFENISASVYCKDKKGKYLSVNNAFIKSCGMHLESDIVGGTDLDLIWKNEAVGMMNNDSEIISIDSTKTYIENALSPNNQIVQYLSHKTPLKSRTGKIIGTFGLSFLISSNTALSSALTKVSSMIENPIMHNHFKDYALKLSIETFNLSPRQAECLYYLARGMTLKQIGRQLTLSPRTVEHHIDLVKFKLNCHTRAELIAKMLHLLMKIDS